MMVFAKRLAVLPSRSDEQSGRCVVKGRKKYSLERKAFAKWFSRWQMMQELAREWKEGEGQRWPLPFWCATPVWPNDWPAPGAEPELLSPPEEEAQQGRQHQLLGNAEMHRRMR